MRRTVLRGSRMLVEGLSLPVLVSLQCFPPSMPGIKFFCTNKPPDNSTDPSHHSTENQTCQGHSTDVQTSKQRHSVFGMEEVPAGRATTVTRMTTQPPCRLWVMCLPAACTCPFIPVHAHSGRCLKATCSPTTSCRVRDI